MKHLRHIDEGIFDIFKSKSTKSLNFTEEELQFIIDGLGNLINNFDAHHSNGDVSTKYTMSRKAKKEYSRIELTTIYPAGLIARIERMILILNKTRTWDGGFKTGYNFWNFRSQAIGFSTIQEFTNAIINAIIIWKISIAIGVTPTAMQELCNEYNVIRGNKVSEFRFKEMIAEIDDERPRVTPRDVNSKVKKLKELGVEFIK